MNWVHPWCSYLWCFNHERKGVFRPSWKKGPNYQEQLEAFGHSEAPKPDSVIQWERRCLACRTRASNVRSLKGPVCPQSPQYVSERVLVNALWAPVGNPKMSGKRAFPLYDRYFVAAPAAWKTHCPCFFIPQKPLSGTLSSPKRNRVLTTQSCGLIPLPSAATIPSKGISRF